MTVIDQIAIIASQAKAEFDSVVMYLSLAAVVVSVLGGMLAFAAKCFMPVIEWVRRHGLQALWLAPFVLCVVYVGMTKGRVTFPYTDVETRYLFDAGSYVSNDCVHVAFTRSVVVPEYADFVGCARPAGSTNDEEWVMFLDTTFAEFHSPSNIPYANAISNDFAFFTTYTPGPVVHTNGVAVVNWQRNFAGDDHYLAMIRTGVYTNSVRMAPNAGITNGPPVIMMMLNPNRSDEDE